MSLQTNISDLATRVATEFKAVRTLIGGTGTSDVSGLATTATNLVGAINEVKDVADSAAGGGISEGEVQDMIDASISDLVDGAPTALDTLKELADALAEDDDAIAALTTAIDSKADDDEVVKLTGNQTVAGTKTFSSAPAVPDSSFAIAKTTGLQAALDAKATTASVGDTSTNFVTVFEAGLA